MPCEYTIRGAGVAVSEEVQDPSRCGDPSPYDAENDERQQDRTVGKGVSNMLVKLNWAVQKNSNRIDSENGVCLL